MAINTLYRSMRISDKGARGSSRIVLPRPRFVSSVFGCLMVFVRKFRVICFSPWGQIQRSDTQHSFDGRSFFMKDETHVPVAEKTWDDSVAYQSGRHDD